MVQSCRFSIVLMLKGLNANTKIQWTQLKIESVWFEVSLLEKLQKFMPAKKRSWSIALPFLKRSEANTYKTYVFIYSSINQIVQEPCASKSDSICMFFLTHKSSCMQNGMNNAGTELPEWIIFHWEPGTDGFPYRNGLGTMETNARKCLSNWCVSMFFSLNFNVLVHTNVVLCQW